MAKTCRGGSVILPNPFSPKKEKPVTEAVKPSEQTEIKTLHEVMSDMMNDNCEIDYPIAPDNLPMNKDTQQEILEAGEPLRTLETSNFRVSYHKQLGSLRISVRRKAGRYMQFDANDARELYAALGFMIDRYKLDKDDEFEQKE